jgi:hypothetical protein
MNMSVASYTVNAFDVIHLFTTKIHHNDLYVEFNKMLYQLYR